MLVPETTTGTVASSAVDDKDTWGLGWLANGVVKPEVRDVSPKMVKRPRRMVVFLVA